MLFAGLATAAFGVPAAHADFVVVKGNIAPANCHRNAVGTPPSSTWRSNCWVGQKYISQGEYVEGVQIILHDLGINTGAIDGVFGPQTRSAVVWFQATHHLTADGVVGPNTWAALGSQLTREGPEPGSPSWTEYGIGNDHHRFQVKTGNPVGQQIWGFVWGNEGPIFGG